MIRFTHASCGHVRPSRTMRRVRSPAWVRRPTKSPVFRHNSVTPGATRGNTSSQLFENAARANHICASFCFKAGYLGTSTGAPRRKHAENNVAGPASQLNAKPRSSSSAHREDLQAVASVRTSVARLHPNPRYCGGHADRTSRSPRQTGWERTLVMPRTAGLSAF